MLNVVMLNEIILSVMVPYFGCHDIEHDGTHNDGLKCILLSIVMLSSVILIVAMLSIFNYCGGEFCCAKCSYAVLLCHYCEYR